MLDRKLAVKDIVLLRSETARVFQENAIDFCCGGNVTVDDACAKRGIDADVVWREVEAAVAERGAPEEDMRALSTPALIARIVERHHAYLRRALPYAQALMAKVARVHGDHNQKLHALKRTVDDLSAMLLTHLDIEERDLFPLLTSSAPPRERLDEEATEMFEDHLAVGKALEKMRDFADGFEPPEWACNSYRALLSELHAIETDTMRHVHLENHVLAPRFVAKEVESHAQSAR